MIKFLFKTAAYTVIGVLLLHGAHTLYVRYRDRNFDIEVEAQAARHFAEKSSEWVKDMLAEQKVKFAEAAPPQDPDEAGIVDVAVPGDPELREVHLDAGSHNRKNRRQFRNTIKALSMTESLLKSEETE